MTYEENIQVLTERLTEDERERVIPFKADRNKIIRLAQLCYQKNIDTVAPNILFSIIDDILSEAH